MTLDDLNEAIKQYTAEELEREGVVTGWVLFVSSNRYDDDGDMLYAHDYSIGPDCSIDRAIGLTEIGYNRMKRDVSGY